MTELRRGLSRFPGRRRESAYQDSLLLALPVRRSHGGLLVHVRAGTRGILPDYKAHLRPVEGSGFRVRSVENTCISPESTADNNLRSNDSQTGRLEVECVAAQTS